MRPRSPMPAVSGSRKRRARSAGKAIVRIESNVRPGEKAVRVKETYRIDESLTFAEGLVFDAQAPVVGRDRDRREEFLRLVADRPR